MTMIDLKKLWTFDWSQVPDLPLDLNLDIWSLRIQVDAEGIELSMYPNETEGRAYDIWTCQFDHDMHFKGCITEHCVPPPYPTPPSDGWDDPPSLPDNGSQRT